MKKADIKVGEEYVQTNDQDHYRWKGSNARVRVLEHVEVPREAWSRRGSTVPGVMVQILDAETGEPMTRMVLDDEMEATGEVVEVEPRRVANRTIKEPWATYKANIAASEAREKEWAKQKADTEAKQAVINNAVLDEIKSRVPEFGEGYGAYHFPDYKERGFRSGQDTSIEVSVEVMARLLGIEVPS